MPTMEKPKVYWMPGCTSCLNTKEYLKRNKIDFESRNVAADPGAYDELAKFGLKRIPIVVVGDKWADGQILSDVAKLCGIQQVLRNRLSPAELIERQNRVMDAALRMIDQIPEEKLGENLPNRPRTYRQLSCHIFQNYEVCLKLFENGRPLVMGDLDQAVPPEMQSKKGLLDFGKSVKSRINAWFAKSGKDTDFNKRANVYYGEQTGHEFLERTTWHSAQHTRQLAEVIKHLGAMPNQPLTAKDLEGLPMPENIYDDQIKIAS